jgi:hypothetical protein
MIGDAYMKNKKGFVLVESIIAAVFVLALSTFLILNIAFLNFSMFFMPKWGWCWQVFYSNCYIL